MQSTRTEIFAKEAVRRSRVDPVWFCENILNLRTLPGEPTFEEAPARSWELDDWQRELLEAASDAYIVMKRNNPAMDTMDFAEEELKTRHNHDGKTYITIRSMHGPGKTFGLALLAHWFGFCFYSRNFATAPKLAQLKTRLWPEFRKINRRAVPEYRKFTSIQAGQVRWWSSQFNGGDYDPDHSLTPETASDPENLAGRHDNYMLILVDEASGVSEDLWPVVEGAASTGIFVLLVIVSNPTKNTGTFADSHKKERVARDYYRMHISVAKTRRVSREWIRRMETKYGKGSPVVQVRCYGEFADEDENQLISLQWLYAAKDCEFKEDGSFPTLRISVDVADGGEDFSVITAARHYETFTHLLRQEQHNFPHAQSIVDAAREAEKMFIRYGGRKKEDDFVVDSLGVGAGTAGILIKAGYRVTRYVGGAASDVPKLYRNRRVQSYLVGRDELRSQRVVIDPGFLDDEDEWDDFFAQMCMIKVKPGLERVEDLETKKELKLREGLSPDRADSWAMQWMGSAPEMAVTLDTVEMYGGEAEEAYDGSLGSDYGIGATKYDGSLSI